MNFVILFNVLFNISVFINIYIYIYLLILFLFLLTCFWLKFDILQTSNSNRYHSDSSSPAPLSLSVLNVLSYFQTGEGNLRCRMCAHACEIMPQLWHPSDPCESNPAERKQSQIPEERRARSPARQSPTRQCICSNERTHGKSASASRANLAALAFLTS